MKSGLQSRTGFRTPSPEGRAVRRAAVPVSPERFRRHPAEDRTPDAVPEPQECSPQSEPPASAGAFVLRRLKTGRALLCAAALFWLMPVAAQSPQAAAPSPQAATQSPQASSSPQVPSSPQFSLGTSAVDSVPQTTVVPVQQQPVQLVEHTTVYEDPARGMTRPERRAYRARLYAQKIDSLVQSRDYMFFPNSMQEIPGGLIRSIYADYFFFGMFVDHVEIHLPTERGVTQYVEMLNFDSMSIRSYQAAHLQWGWCISFDVADDNRVYHAEFAVSTATGETVLTLLTPDVTMRYVGWLWNKRMGDPKFRRID